MAFYDPLVQEVSRNPLPETLDLRELLGPIRDQGMCGSCWSFSFIASVEGQLALHGIPYKGLSEQ